MHCSSAQCIPINFKVYSLSNSAATGIQRGVSENGFHIRGCLEEKKDIKNGLYSNDKLLCQNSHMVVTMNPYGPIISYREKACIVVKCKNTVYFPTKMCFSFLFCLLLHQKDNLHLSYMNSKINCMEWS